MTGFNMTMPGNSAEASVSPGIKSYLSEKPLPNKKGEFFKQFKKIQETGVKGHAFTGKYGRACENGKIMNSGLGTETSNNVDGPDNKLLFEPLYGDNSPEINSTTKSQQLILGKLPEQGVTEAEDVSLQNETLVLADSTKPTGELEESGQAVVAKKSTLVINGIVLDRDSLKQVALSGNSIQFPEAELETHSQIFKPVEPIPGLQPEQDKQLKNAASHENQSGAQITGEPGTAQPELTNDIHNQHVGKEVHLGQPKLDPAVVQASSQDILVPVEDSMEAAPIRTNPEPPQEVLKLLESIPDSQPDQDKQMKGIAGHENQSRIQIPNEPGPAQPEATNNVYNQQDNKGPDAAQLKLDPPVVQVGSQDSLVSVEGSEKVVHSQVPVEGSKEAAPIRTNPEPSLEVLKPLESIPNSQSEQDKQLKGAVGHANKSGAQVTGEPGPAQPEPTNNVHNQHVGKESDAGRLKLDPSVAQAISEDSLVSVEGGKKVVAQGANSAEVLKSLEPIPDMQTEPGKQLKVAAGYENQLATKSAEKGMDIQPPVEMDVSKNLSQQAAVASTIAGTRETESGKGKTTSLVDKQVEVDVRATPDRPLVQASRVNHSSNTTRPGFEQTVNHETGEKADATRKESPSVDVRKLIEFENHRLKGTKLNALEGNRENLFKEAGDETRPNLSVLNRSDWEWLRNGIRNPGMETGSRFVTNTREIIDQVVQKAELLLRANVSELKVELKPEFLGRLTIKVALEDGAVIARLIAENQQVKHMLESNLTSLKQSLESQGIKVERAEVSVQLNNGGMFDGSEDSRQYLWQEHQHSQQHPDKYWGDGVYSKESLEILEPEGVVEGSDYGINENGNLDFLI